MNESFRPTKEWPLQETYKRALHDRIQRWGDRVAPMLERMPTDQRQRREQLFEFLVTSVIRGDRETAEMVSAVDSFVRDYLEGQGPYGRGGGSIESSAGFKMYQNQFEGLYAIFEAGRSLSQSDESN